MLEEGFSEVKDSVAEFSEAIKDWSDTHNSQLGAIILEEDADLAAFNQEVGTIIDV